MDTKCFRIVEIADIHFGNGRVPPSMTYENLETILYPNLKDIDLFVINGDTFDTMLNMNSDAGYYVAKFINDVIELAVNNKFYIRVVRGTFSHDRHQNRFFLTRGKEDLTLNNKQLVKVYDTIAIENFSKFNFLFCPDNLPFKDLTQEVIDVIDSNHLKKVDCIFSHGYFTHLLPENLPHMPIDTLEWDKLKSKVSGYVLNGHVHHLKVSDRVISSSSFERFDHSNTEKVGYWIVEYKNGKWSPTFVENKQSLEFKTFYPTIDDTDEDILNSIKRYIEELIYDGYPKDKPIYIRIAGKDNGILQNIKTEYPNVVTSVKPQKADQPDLLDYKLLYENLPTITEANLAELIYQAIEPHGIIPEEEIREIINGI